MNSEVEWARPELTESLTSAFSAEGMLERLLRSVREHLELDVAFIGQFVDGHRVFRYVDGSTGGLIAPFKSDPLEQTYCGRVAEGRIPGFLRDPREHPAAAGLAVTEELPVGTHLSVPIRFSDGRLYGSFCCFSFGVSTTLDARDLRSLEMVAEIAAEYVEIADAAVAAHRQKHETISGIVADGTSLRLVFQPLRDLRTMAIVGVEALSRFDGFDRGPEWVFDAAEQCGLGLQLDVAAVRLALSSLAEIPAPIRLNINVSAATITSEDFFDAVVGVEADRLVLEVTEHVAISDYSEMKRASARLTELGIWLAIDDVGMGFSGLHRILQSSPEVLKLDRVVVSDCDTNMTKQAMIEALSGFGVRAGFDVVAEGIETQAELDMVCSLGVPIGQGYHLGRPDALSAVLDLRSRQSLAGGEPATATARRSVGGLSPAPGAP